MTKAKKKPRKAPQRERFVDEFMIDRNATKAAIRCGYAPNSAAQTGYKLLRNAQILAEINKRGAEQSQRLQITSDRIMQEYERLALLDPLDLFNADGSMKALADIPEDARRAIGGLELRELSSIETPGGPISVQLKKIKLVDKKGALDSLAKILGMMREKVDVSLKSDQPIVVKIIRKGNSE